MPLGGSASRQRSPLLPKTTELVERRSSASSVGAPVLVVKNSSSKSGAAGKQTPLSSVGPPPSSAAGGAASAGEIVPDPKPSPSSEKKARGGFFGLGRKKRSAGSGGGGSGASAGTPGSVASVVEGVHNAPPSSLSPSIGSPTLRAEETPWSEDLELPQIPGASGRGSHYRFGELSASTGAAAWGRRGSGEQSGAPAADDNRYGGYEPVLGRDFS